MLRDIDRRATSILSTDRNVDESVERTGVLTQRIAEGGGVGEGEALVSWLHRDLCGRCGSGRHEDQYERKADGQRGIE